MESKIKIFCCYAHKDKNTFEELKSHLMPLQRQGFIELWNDADIGPGIEWEEAINHHLDSAQIILLLISSDFIASDYCYSREMTRAMERHKQGEARVIPVILRPTYWQDMPFGKLQALPENAIPIKSSHWFSSDDAFLNITENISLAIKELLQPLSTDEDSSRENFTNEGDAFFQNDAIPTGFEDLDRIMGGGFHRSDLITVCAPPYTGKTSFSLNIISNVALKRNHSVGIFSLEMKKERLIQYFYAINSRVSYQGIITGTLDDKEWEYIVSTMAEIENANIWIYDIPRITISELQKQAQRMIHEYKVDLIVIDHLDFIRREENQYQNQYDKDREMSLCLKMLARELDIPIMLLIHKPLVKNTSYSFGSPNSSRPGLIDVSGDPIVSYADAVLVLYREDLYNPDSERRNIMDIIITKNLNGVVGNNEISFYFNPEMMYLRDLEVYSPKGTLNNEVPLADTYKDND